MQPDRLYFVTRRDLSEGRRAAQLIHAMDLWCEKHGSQKGTVIVYAVPNKRVLEAECSKRESAITFREPDLRDSLTAFVTDEGPLDLPLL